MAGSILETFYILFQTDAKRAEAEATQAVGGMAAATSAADLKQIASEATKTAARMAGAAKVAVAQAEVAEAELGVTNAVAVRQAAEAAQAAARLAQSKAIIAAEAAQAAATVETSRVTEVAGEAAHRFGAGLGEIARNAVATIGALLAVDAAVEAVKGSFERVNQLVEEADRFGFDKNVEGFVAVTEALKEQGGNAEKATRVMRRFADAIAEAYGDANSKTAKALREIGVNAKDANGDLKDTEQIMLDIAGGIGKVGKQKQIDILRDLGLRDPALRSLMLGGRDSLAARLDEVRGKGIITNEQAQQIREFSLAWDHAKNAVGGFFNTLASSWAPDLENFAHGVEEFVFWLRRHATLVQGLALGVGLALTAVAAILWGTYIPAWIAAAVAVIAATWPVLAIIAAVGVAAAAFALLWEDVQAFLHGYPSLLGELIAKHAWLKDTIDFIAVAFRNMGKWGAEAWNGLISGAKAFGAWAAPFFRGLGEIVGPIFRLIVDGAVAMGRVLGPVLFAVLKGLVAILREILAIGFEAVKGLVTTVGQALAAVAKFIGPIWNDMFKGWLKQLDLLVAGIRTLFGLRPDLQVNRALGIAAPGAAGPPPGVAKGQMALAVARTAPLASLTSQGVASRAAHTPVSKHYTVKVDKVEVHTQATDADGMAAAAAGALTTHLRRATDHFDDGVDR
jgi:TP901 family phage tail tape measure protein